MKLNIAIIQLDIIWENIQQNLDVLESMFNELDDSIDLVLLPEMFLTGFSMNIEQIAVSIDGVEVVKLKEWSKKKNLAILGSLAVKKNDKVYNSALFIKPNGEITIYNKRHLFRMGEEDNYFEKGDHRTIVDFKGIRIMPQICYDLRFPVWSRNRNDYDLLVYMANWPGSRQKVWNVLLEARAIENQSYTVGINRVGEGGGIKYLGGSKLVDYKGIVVKDLELNSNAYCVLQLDINKQNNFRTKFPAHQDSDEFNIL